MAESADEPRPKAVKGEEAERIKREVLAACGAGWGEAAEGEVQRDDPGRLLGRIAASVAVQVRAVRADAGHRGPVLPVDSAVFGLSHQGAEHGSLGPELGVRRVRGGARPGCERGREHPGRGGCGRTGRRRPVCRRGGRHRRSSGRRRWRPVLRPRRNGLCIRTDGPSAVMPVEPVSDRACAAQQGCAWSAVGDEAGSSGLGQKTVALPQRRVGSKAGGSPTRPAPAGGRSRKFPRNSQPWNY